MSDEPILASIDRLVTPGRTQVEYTLVLTEARAIFVEVRRVRLWRDALLFLGCGALGLLLALVLYPTTVGVIIGLVAGGYLGVAVGRSLAPRRRPDPSAGPDELARLEGTRVIAVDDLSSVAIVPSARRFPRIRFTYRGAGGATETFVLMAVVAAGGGWQMTGGSIAARIAEREAEVRLALTRGLPARLAPRTETA